MKITSLNLYFLYVYGVTLMYTFSYFYFLVYLYKMALISLHALEWLLLGVVTARNVETIQKEITRDETRWSQTCQNLYSHGVYLYCHGLNIFGLRFGDFDKACFYYHHGGSCLKNWKWPTLLIGVVAARKLELLRHVFTFTMEVFAWKEFEVRKVNVTYRGRCCA